MQIVPRWAVLTVACTLPLLSTSCASAGGAPEDRPGMTVREIMADMVAPAADVLWAAIQTVETPDGYADKAPETDEEWGALRRSATATIEAAALLRLEGRPVAPPGATASSPGYQLEPDSIARLVSSERARWIGYVEELRAAGQAFLDAIDARDASPLFDLGDGLNTACEDCHQVFWYPSP